MVFLFFYFCCLAHKRVEELFVQGSIYVWRVYGGTFPEVAQPISSLHKLPEAITHPYGGFIVALHLFKLIGLQGTVHWVPRRQVMDEAGWGKVLTFGDTLLTYLTAQMPHNEFRFRTPSKDWYHNFERLGQSMTFSLQSFHSCSIYVHSTHSTFIYQSLHLSTLIITHFTTSSSFKAILLV